MLAAAARLAFICVVYPALVPGPCHAVEIDRLIASVNGVAITESDLELARTLNAVVFYGKTAAAVSLHDEIETQIDQELMRQELQNFSMQDEEGRVEARMRSLWNACHPAGGLSGLLTQAGLQESELVSYIRLEISIMRFVDFRFRPFVSVSQEEIQTYYRERLTPQLQKSGIALPELNQISAKIDSIIREEKINRVLDQWIKEIRRSSRIEYFEEPK